MRLVSVQHDAETGQAYSPAEWQQLDAGAGVQAQQGHLRDLLLCFVNDWHFVQCMQLLRWLSLVAMVQADLNNASSRSYGL